VTQARLNLFQCAMLRWRELHPYCAAHVIAIPAVLDEARLRATVAGVLQDCGLTGFELDAKRRRLAFRGGPATPAIAILPAGGDPFAAAGDEIRASINRPFPASGAFEPFRFFAIADANQCLLGVVYDHLVAGGDSIAVLVTDIAARYVATRPEDVALAPLALPDRTCRSLFLRRPGAVLRGVLALPRLVRQWRTAVRPKLADAGDGRNGFVHFAVDAGPYQGLRERARGLGITTNDLLLAFVLAAVAPLGGERSPARRRHAVAVASIVNLRDDFQPPPDRVFGQFLSSFRVVHAFPEGTALATLARDLGAQAGEIRRKRLHYLTLLAMGLAAAIWRHASLSRRQRIYLKYHPVLAGITPLGVDALRRHGAARPGDYLRAASTGPMSPLVVALTSSGGALRVGITYRTTAVTEEQARRVARTLQDLILTLPP
jgi:hypothetical protein